MFLKHTNWKCHGHRFRNNRTQNLRRLGKQSHDPVRWISLLKHTKGRKYKTWHSVFVAIQSKTEGYRQLPNALKCKQRDVLWDVTNINGEASHIRDRRENKKPLSLPTTLSPFLIVVCHTWRISRKAIKIPVIIWILHLNRPHLLNELQPQLLSQRWWWGRLPHNTASAPFVLSLILGTTRLEKSPSLVTCPCSPTQPAPLQRSKSWVRLFNIAFGLQKNVSNVWTAVLMPGRLQGLRLLSELKGKHS